MRHAVIVAHPNRRSMTMTLARTYASAVREAGGVAIMRDLYRMRFDPCLKAGEIPKPGGFGPEPDVIAERARLKNVDVFAFFYPLWFNAPPAMTKGYIDRVFGMGFGYSPKGEAQTGLLEGKQMISVTTSGAPEHWVRETGAFSALYSIFDVHLAGVCGLTVVDHVHIGGITPMLALIAVEDAKNQVRDAVRRHFDT